MEMDKWRFFLSTEVDVGLGPLLEGVFKHLLLEYFIALQLSGRITFDWNKWSEYIFYFFFLASLLPFSTAARCPGVRFS